jgi:hypothetical protein
LESDKYADAAINDGDSFPGVYSIRTSKAPLTPGTRDKGLIGYWEFDEGSGSEAHDASGHGNDGSWQGTGPYYSSASKVGSCAGLFNGTDHYVKINNFVGLPTSFSALTIMAWIKTSTSSETVIGDNTPGCGYSFSLSINGPYCSPGTGIPCGYNAADARYNQTYNPSITVNDNLWHYLAMVSGNGTQTLYVDGSPVASSSYTGNIPGPLSILTLGAYTNGGCLSGSYFNGLIDDVRIYNRALSAAEVQAIYNATK